jgi:hypothetical protein
VNLLVRFIEDRRLGLAGLGALGVTIGSALPCLIVPQPLAGTLTTYGLQDDGKITVVLGVLALLLIVAYARLGHRDLVAGATIASAGAAAIVIWYMAHRSENAAKALARLLGGAGVPVDLQSFDLSLPARSGAGLWVVLGGAALVAGAAVSLAIRVAQTDEPISQASP